MFYFIHLTRPPPEKASLDEPIQVTPNIANDLRTEHPQTTHHGIDIYYAWIKAIEDEQPIGHNVTTLSLGPMAQPIKLVNWNGSAYKPVRVPPPKAARDGECWHLLLCTRATSNLSTTGQAQGSYVSIINLAGPSCSSSCGATLREHSSNSHGPLVSDDSGSELHFGACAFPILSCPVRFLTHSSTARPGYHPGRASGKNAAKKQARNERILALGFPSGKFTQVSDVRQGSVPALLRITEHLSYDLDKKVWDSGIGLSHWFVKVLSGGVNKESTPTVARALVGHERPSIVELGAGTGLVSIVLSALLENMHCGRVTENTSDIATVYATDLSSAMPILEENIMVNRALYPLVNLRAAALDWEDEVIPPEIAQNGVDYILMADVTYNTASFPALISTLNRLRHLPRSSRSSISALGPPGPPIDHTTLPPTVAPTNRTDAEPNTPALASQTQTQTQPRAHHAHEKARAQLEAQSHSATAIGGPPVLLAYKERDPDERRLWNDLTRSIGLYLTEIARIAGAGGFPVEIYSGHWELAHGLKKESPEYIDRSSL